MPAADPAFRRATLGDYLDAMQDGRRCEIVDGVLWDKEAGGARHAGVQAEIVGLLHGPFRRPGGPGRPGGWVFMTEPSLAAPLGDVLQPDIAGWHRDRAPADDTFPIPVAPDWVCEVIYSTHDRDVRRKPDIYRAMGVGHLWLLDLKAEVLTVYRLGAEGYLRAGAFGPRETARVEPFDAVELDTWELFGLDEPPPVLRPRDPS